LLHAQGPSPLISISFPVKEFDIRTLPFRTPQREKYAKVPSETLINTRFCGNGHKNHFVWAATAVSKPENEFSTLEK
jgi:hypothetical protein